MRKLLPLIILLGVSCTDSPDETAVDASIELDAAVDADALADVATALDMAPEQDAADMAIESDAAPETLPSVSVFAPHRRRSHLGLYGCRRW